MLHLACEGVVCDANSTCNYLGRCVSAAAIECDSTIANAQEPCDGEGSLACSTDARMLLRCTQGRFVNSSPCPGGGCKSAGGKFLCQ